MLFDEENLYNEMYREVYPEKTECTECGGISEFKTCAEQGPICLECWPIVDSWEIMFLKQNYKAYKKKTLK